MLNKDVSIHPHYLACTFDELETHLDEIDMDSPCLFNIVVAIFLYVDGVVLLSKSRACLQRIVNNVYEFCSSSKIMIFG